MAFLAISLIAARRFSTSMTRAAIEKIIPENAMKGENNHCLCIYFHLGSGPSLPPPLGERAPLPELIPLRHSRCIHPRTVVDEDCHVCNIYSCLMQQPSIFQSQMCTSAAHTGWPKAHTSA